MPKKMLFSIFLASLNCSFHKKYKVVENSSPKKDHCDSPILDLVFLKATRALHMYIHKSTMVYENRKFSQFVSVGSHQNAVSPLKHLKVGDTNFHWKGIWIYLDYNSLESPNLNHMLMSRNVGHREDIAHKPKFGGHSFSFLGKLKFFIKV